MNKPRLPKPIYLAGLPRSGTTWSGKALAAAAHTRMVDEPFNPEFHPEATPYDMKYLPWPQHDNDFNRLLRRAAKEDFFSRLSVWLPYRLNTRLPGARRPFEQVVIKDVHTLMSLETIWKTINAKIVVILRHPGAIAASWRRLEFKGDFRPKKQLLLNQERLMQDHLAAFEGHMKSRNDFYFDVGVYWGAIYHVIRKMDAAGRLGPSAWTTHEALCEDPIAGFEHLFSAIGLPMTKRARTLLGEGNSGYEASKWRKEVSDEDLDSVLAGAEPFGIIDKFY